MVPPLNEGLAFFEAYSIY